MSNCLLGVKTSSNKNIVSALSEEGERQIQEFGESLAARRTNLAQVARSPYPCLRLDVGCKTSQNKISVSECTTSSNRNQDGTCQGFERAQNLRCYGEAPSVSPVVKFRLQAPMTDRPASNRYQISGPAASSTAVSLWSCQGTYR